MVCRADDPSGFTVVELIVSLCLTLLVGLAATAHLDVLTSMARVQPAAADVVGRARAAADLVGADLMMAGAGLEHGLRAGGLGCCVPTVLPRRIGRLGADLSTVAAADRITIVFAPYGTVAGTLRSPLTGWAPPIDVDPVPPCPAGLVVCGWPDGTAVLVSDGREQHDYYQVSVPVGAPPFLRVRQGNPGPAYAAGAFVTPIETHTYYFDAAQAQLRHYDGHASDVPAIDNVAAVAFTYEGESAPPIFPRPPLGEANCLYDASGARWPWILPISGADGNVVDLPLAMLADGPWCGVGDNRFDVDLLRVRRVRMAITLQASDDLRARGTLFVSPGVSRSAKRLVSDVPIVVDVTPRNLNAGR